MQTYLTQNTFREKIFRLRINEETFNVRIERIFSINLSKSSFQDITMVKISCIDMSEIDYSEYGRRLLNVIENGS